MSQPETEFSVAGQRITHEIHGEGEPLMLLANVAAGDVCQRALVPSLNNAGYQVVIPQHLGPKPSTVLEIAADMGALLDHLDLGPIRLMGYSMGAWIAQELALLRPDRIRAAAMVATTGRKNAFGKVRLAAYSSVMARLKEFSEIKVVQDLLAFPPKVLGNDELISPMVESMTEAYKAGMAFDPDKEKRAAHAVMTYDNRLEALANVKLPCLVISFELDLLMHARQGQEVSEAIPGCRYIEIPGFGHATFLENADDVMAHVLDFLSTV